jgi:FKBP-type peptidyl-prolyl cis-trans isomerase 2
MSLHCSAVFTKKKKVCLFWSTHGKDHGVVDAVDNREVVGEAKVYLYGVGQGKQIEGWQLAVPTMRLGESCRVDISAGYAYGAEGLPVWSIPPNRDLTYYIECLEIT